MIEMAIYVHRFQKNVMQYLMGYLYPQKRKWKGLLKKVRKIWKFPYVYHVS